MNPLYGMTPAFPGMKADTGYDRIETVAAAADIPFGVVVGLDDGFNGAPGAGTKGARGISLHSHTVVTGKYLQYDAVSVMRRGSVWAQVEAGQACTQEGPVKFNAAGLVSDAGTTALTNATFKSAAIDAGDYGLIVMVELHDPTQIDPNITTP